MGEGHEERLVKAEPQPVPREGSLAVVATTPAQAFPTEHRVRQRETDRERERARERKREAERERESGGTSDTLQNVARRSSKITMTTVAKISLHLSLIHI